jgi:hypothetical protein
MYNNILVTKLHDWLQRTKFVLVPLVPSSGASNRNVASNISLESKSDS